jgi:predicted DNA-binding transcriptional regulator
VNNRKEESRLAEMKIMKNRIKIWNYLVKKDNKARCIPKDLETKVLQKKDREKFDQIILGKY